jgi:DNA-binding transcriptional regulator YdaS (Cro superfamily)
MSRKQRDISLARAISQAGSLKALAEPCEVTEQAVCQWEQVPPRHVLTVERVSGVSRHDLRPDLYPRKQQQRRVEIAA